MTFDVHYYVTDGGRDVFLDWISGVRDVVAKAAISRRVNRLRVGHFGDHAFCREEVGEARIAVGPGYRVYYARTGRHILLLPGGGDKHSQPYDISRACEYLRNEKRRLSDAK